MSKPLNVRCNLPSATALTLAIARSGRCLVAVSEPGLAELSEEERRALARFVTDQQSEEEAFRYSADTLTLLAAPSWDAAVQALREELAETARRREELAAAMAAATRKLLAVDPTTVTTWDAPAALAAACGCGNCQEGHLLRGTVTPTGDTAPEVRAWLEVARASALAGERARDLALLATETPGMNPRYETECALRRLLGVSGPHVVTEVILGEATPERECPEAMAWIAAARAARAALVAQNARDAAEREAARMQARERLLTWAFARSEEVRDGIAEGYDQASIAERMVLDAITAALSRPDCRPVEFDSGEMKPRRSIDARGIAGLKATRTALEKLLPELPEGTRAEVGRVSRWETDGKKLTAIPVTFTGTLTTTAIVPLE